MQIIDLHCDTILHLIDQPLLKLKKNNLSVDIQKLKAGNGVAQFFALYIDLNKHQNALQRCLSMLDVFYHEIEANSADIAIARNYQEMCVLEQAGKISAFLTIEEGGALQGRLDNLRNFYRLGVRLLTLTWNYPNEIGYPSCEAKYEVQGLTEFGQQVVHEMNHLGMIIDVSHLSDQGFYDVARLSSKPFVASHSNARVVQNHHRNMTDDMIRLLAQKGGVMGINFSGSFLGASQISKVDDMVNHIKHIHQVGGSDVLALGTDFDGIDYTLEIANMSEMHKLFDSLQKNGFTAQQIEKLAYQNTVRVIQDCL